MSLRCALYHISQFKRFYESYNYKKKVIKRKYCLYLCFLFDQTQSISFFFGTYRNKQQQMVENSIKIIKCTVENPAAFDRVPAFSCSFPFSPPQILQNQHRIGMGYQLFFVL